MHVSYDPGPQKQSSAPRIDLPVRASMHPQHKLQVEKGYSISDVFAEDAVLELMKLNVLQIRSLCKMINFFSLGKNI